MPIKTPKELFVVMLSDLRHGAERSHTYYRNWPSGGRPGDQRGPGCARLHLFADSEQARRVLQTHRGEAAPEDEGFYDEFVQGFRKELAEIQSPLVRKMFVLSKASRLMHLRIGEYMALIRLRICWTIQPSACFSKLASLTSSLLWNARSASSANTFGKRSQPSVGHSGQVEVRQKHPGGASTRRRTTRLANDSLRCEESARSPRPLWRPRSVAAPDFESSMIACTPACISTL